MPDLPSVLAHRSRPTRTARRAALAVAGALVATGGGACGGGENRRSVVEQAVALAPEIEKGTGLRFRQPPRVEVKGRADVRAYVTRALDEPTAREELAGRQAVWRRLGLIPDTLELRPLLQRLYGQQVIGLYDPKSKTLYVVQGADSASADVTLRHELVHALQDQHRNLDSLLSVAGANDRTAAAQAALEGQASWLQFAGDMAARMPGGWERARDAIRTNLERDPALAEAPLIVRETMIFPYLAGAELARAVATSGHPDSVLLRLPQSTEQVLHAQAYLGTKGGRPDVPTEVAIPRVAGTLAGENTLGEFEIRLLVYQHTNDLGLAARAATGWGGDRWQLLRTAGGEALVWLSVWDTGADAAEFYEAMSQVVPARYRGARAAAAPAAGASPAGSATTRTFEVANTPGGARTVVVRALDVQGRPAVLVIDAPAGAVPAVDAARATLRR